MTSLNISREPRRRGLPTLWWLAALAGMYAGPACAIDPGRAMSQYVRDHWGPEQGFPRGSVYAIAQTPDGYLWIGSDAGLIRFDGLNFQLMRDPSESLVFGSVLGLVADAQGSLWMRLRDTTLIRYRNGEFEDPFSAWPVSEITAAARSNDGEILAARLQAGAFRLRNGRLQLAAAAKGVPRSPVISLAQTGNGDVWLGMRGGGLFRLAGGATIPVTQGLPDPKVNALLPDGASGLWIGTDNGIARWDGTQLTGTGVAASLRNVQVLAMVKDRDGNLWMGTDSRGLLRLNSQGLSALDAPESNESGAGRGVAVTAVFEDREGDLWSGSADGLERLRDSAFVSYSGPEGLPTDGSNPVFVDSENRMWFPPVTGGLWWFKDGRHGSVAQAGLRNDIVYSIAGGGDELWLGRQRGGLTRLRTAAGSFETTTYTQADGLAQNSVYSVYEARDGAVWAGTLSGGVSKLERGKFTNYGTADGLASNTVVSILESPEGTMWFATPGGLSAFSQSGWQTFTSRDGLPSDNVNCLLADSEGVLWAGTTAGLAFRRNGRFQAPARVPASLREQILGIAEDRFGALWIATSNHVLRARRDALLKGPLSDDDVRSYGQADGLRGVEGVKRHRSVVTDSLGRIWFSLNRGISVVDPARLTSRSMPAVARVQTLSANSAGIDLRGPVHIRSGRQRIVFGYGAMSLSAPERIRFRYQLDGYDHGWIETSGNREAVYTNLGPGPYRFRVIASNPDGVWNQHESVIAFNVDPATWQTWWFQTACALGGILIALGAYWLRMRQLTATLNVRFEERLAERTRIAQELHDTLLQGFISASMQIHVAADRLPPESPVKPSLVRALDLMREVTEEGRNVVRGLRTAAGATHDLERAFSQIQNEVVPGEPAGDRADFRIIVEGKRRPLRPVLRDEVYRIGREALINAFRHARARKIEIELDYSFSSLRVLVRDDGRGIDPQTLVTGRDGHWGLSGMRERADRIHARLQIWSGTAGGTEVELLVPGSVAFEDQPRSVAGWFRSLRTGPTR